MATETGHAKNIANFENLISIVNGYGAQYNPSNPNIELRNLETLKTNAKKALDTLYSSTTSYVNAINTRQGAFEDLKKLSTRIISALEASGAEPATVESAISINRKVQGARAGKLTKADAGKTEGLNTDPSSPAPPEPTNISVSQQSFDSLIEHFSRLITMIGSEPLYKPNESDLSITNLKAKLTTLQNTNSSAINNHTTVSTARISRNEILYGTNTGVCDIAAQVKSYTKSIYGATSPNYKLISKLEFRKAKS